MGDAFSTWVTPRLRSPSKFRAAPREPAGGLALKKCSSNALLRDLPGRAVVGIVEAVEYGLTDVQAVQEAAGLTVLVCKLPHCHKLLYG